MSLLSESIRSKKTRPVIFLFLFLKGGGQLSSNCDAQQDMIKENFVSCREQLIYSM